MVVAGQQLVLGERPRGDDAGHLPAHAVAVVALVGDRDPVASLDQCRQVRLQVVDRASKGADTERIEFELRES